MSCLATPLRLLPISRSELHLASTLPSGQSFRWHRLAPPHATLPDRPPCGPDATKSVAEGAEEWAFGWADRTVVLRQDGALSHVLHGGPPRRNPRIHSLPFMMHRQRYPLPRTLSFQTAPRSVPRRPRNGHDPEPAHDLFPTRHTARAPVRRLVDPGSEIRPQDQTREGEARRDPSPQAE
jgi:hypothetical protein